MTTATARACANIALVKYWGKRDAARNLPSTGSLSLTLDALVTETRVDFDETLDTDAMRLDGRDATPGELARTSKFLDEVRAMAGFEARARVDSTNHFPTASGLASSASGYAALALAASTAAGLSLAPRELSVLARRGSGSAARSVFGGLARVVADPDVAYAEPVPDPHGLAGRLRMVIAIVGGGAPKTHGSRDAMEHSAATSPYHAAWLETVVRDLAAAEDAIARGDAGALGAIAEPNALAMHAAAIAARPPILYWQPATLAALATVRALRADGRFAWATMDAGPHVKVLTDEVDAAAVADAMTATAGVDRAIVSAAGPGAALV